MRLPGLQTDPRRGYGPPVTVGQAGAFWRTIASICITIVAILVIANTISHPTKRNIQVLAGLAFAGFMIASHPVRAFYLGLALLPFHLNTSVGTTTTLLIFAIGAVVLAKSRSMRLDPAPKDTRLTMFMLGWILTMLLSLAQTPAEVMRLSLLDLQSFAAAIILFYMMAQLVRDEVDLHNMLRTIHLVTILVAVISLLQASFPHRSWLPSVFSYESQMANMDMEREAGKVRAFATFAGYEFFAEYMAMSVIMQFILMRMSRSALERGLWAFGVGACFLALIASATRGPILALAVAIVWMVGAGRGAVPRGRIIMLLFGAVILLQIVGLAAPHLVEQMVDRMSEDLTAADSMNSRAIAWEQALDAIAASPLLGHGLEVPVGRWKGGVSTNIHSLYIHLAYTIGIPGLLLFGGLVFRLFQISLRRARDRSQSVFLRHLMMGCNSIIILFAIDQLKIEYLRSAIHIQLVFAHFGLIFAAEKLARRRGHEEEYVAFEQLRFLSDDHRA